jgi:ferredoxin
MSLTRKEFLRQGFFSLGKTALDIAETLKGETVGEPVPASEASEAPEPRPDMLAESFNERCLARNCGCFACVERCEPQAIMVVPGEGIRIDGERCTGCGMCEYVCPVVPKAVALIPR